MTAPPDFSQSSTPFRLLVPRHPPHALTSLAALLAPPLRRRNRTASTLPASIFPSHLGATRADDLFLTSKARVLSLHCHALGHHSHRTNPPFRAGPIRRQWHRTDATNLLHHVVKDRSRERPNRSHFLGNQCRPVKARPITRVVRSPCRAKRTQYQLEQPTPTLLFLAPTRDSSSLSECYQQRPDRQPYFLSQPLATAALASLLRS